MEDILFKVFTYAFMPGSVAISIGGLFFFVYTLKELFFMMVDKDKMFFFVLMAFLVSSGSAGTIAFVLKEALDLSKVYTISVTMAIWVPLFLILETLFYIIAKINENNKKELTNSDT